MDYEEVVVKCECCGLKEECTWEYINGVKSMFNGKWLCGLCSEAVRDELAFGKARQGSVEEAVTSHTSFCRKSKSSPAFRVADGMRLMLRRRSAATAAAPSPSPTSMAKYARSSGQVNRSTLYNV